jgi:hypothetical protein
MVKRILIEINGRYYYVNKSKDEFGAHDVKVTKRPKGAKDIIGKNNR